MMDVAKEAGVSTATVSAVINGITTRIPVSEASRTKVKEAIRKLNYQVNEHARSLRTGKSFTIGVVVSDITQPFSGEMIRVIERELSSRNYNFLLSDVQNNKEREHFYLQLFLQKKVDGILFVGASNELDDQGIQDLLRAGIPVVLTEREVSEKNVPCVLVDNIKGGFMATDHLIQQGYAHITFIVGPSQNAVSIERLEGYKSALMQNNREFSDAGIVEGGISLEDGYNAMQSLLSRAEIPTAVVAFNDSLALGAMRAIKDKGLNVPEDIAVIGYDDIPMASYCDPSLTTIRQPILRMCQEAAGLLLDILGEKYPRDYFKKTVLEPELVIRKSCGCGRQKSG
jgi:DNA-binding LacI/PurR family transcriptional regulator